MSHNVIVSYLGGLPGLTDFATYTLAIDTSGITIQTGTFKKTDFVTYSWSEIDVAVGTEEEIKERLTLSRVALVGPFAVFFKKKKSKVEYFLTISKDGFHGLFKVPNATSFFKNTIVFIEMHRRPVINVNASTSSTTSAIDPLDRLEKLGRLLEQGILTQDEFDKKKAEILDL